MAQKLTPEAMESIRSDYAAKLPVQEICAKHGISRPTLFSYVEPCRRPGLNHPQAMQAMGLLDSGLSLRRTAAIAGVPHQTVFSWKRLLTA